MADIKDQNSPPRWQKFCRISTFKSSSDPTAQSASRSYRNDGSSSEPSPGSIAAEDLPKIGKISTARRSHSCASPQFASCSENYAIRPQLSGQTLRKIECASSFLRKKTTLLLDDGLSPRRLSAYDLPRIRSQL